MQYPESTSAVVEQAWPEPGSLKPRGGHHLEPQGPRAYSSAVPRATPYPPHPVISLLIVSRTPLLAARGLSQ